MKTQAVNRVVASFFSIIFPGSGQFANGQWLKGLLAILLVFGSVYVPMPDLVMMLFCYLLVWVLCLIDAYQVANRRDQRGESVRWLLLVVGGLLSLAMIVVCVVFLIYSFFDKSDSEKEQARQEAEKRLEQMYHDDFTVQPEVDYSWNLGTYSMQAKSKAHPDLSISVSLSDADSRELTDNYLEKVWSQEQQSRLMPVVQEIFGGDLLLYSNASPNQQFKNDLKSMQEVPRYQDMQDRFPEQLDQDVRVYLFGSYKAEMEQQTLEKTLQFIQKFPEQEKKHLDVMVCWLDPSIKKKINVETGQEMYEYLLTNSSTEKQFELHIWDGKVPEIKTVDQLKPYIWK